MRPPPDSGPPHLEPPWEPLEGGGIGTMMPRRARSWAWKGGAAREWREAKAARRARAANPGWWCWSSTRASGPRCGGAARPRRTGGPRCANGSGACRPSVPPVAVEQPTAAHLADDGDWTRGIWWGATVGAAEATMREDLWRFGPPRGRKTGRIVRMDDGEEDDG